MLGSKLSLLFALILLFGMAKFIFFNVNKNDQLLHSLLVPTLADDNDDDIDDDNDNNNNNDEAAAADIGDLNGIDDNDFEDENIDSDDDSNGHRQHQ